MSAVGGSDVFQRRLVELGLDVHDGPLQDLSALRLDLALFRNQIEDVLRARAAEEADRVLGRVEDLTARLESAEDELRRLASLAGSSTLLAGPLTSAFRRTVREHSNGLEVDVRLDPEIDRLALGDEERIAVLRSVQAAVSNVERHSNARRARVSATSTGGHVVVEVSDDGTGFDVDAIAESASEAGRLGLFGMHERVKDLGGELSVESVIGAGTRVTVRVPHRSAGHLDRGRAETLPPHLTASSRREYVRAEGDGHALRHGDPDRHQERRGDDRADRRAGSTAG